MKVRQIAAIVSIAVASGSFGCGGRAYPSQIAVDRSNRVFICNDDGVKIFGPNGGSLEASIKPPNTLTSLCPFAVSAGGTIYVPPSGAGDNRDLQAYRETRPGVIEHVGWLGPVSPADEYIAGFSMPADGIVMSARPGDKTLSRYQIVGGRNLRLVATIAGPKTQLTHPVMIASGSDGSTCVASMGESGGTTTIACFDGTASGDVKPDRTIAGPRTELANIDGLTIADDGSVAVVCLDAYRILVFNRRANGDVPPTRIIEGTATGLDDPSGVALDKTGGIYAVNGPPKTVTYYRSGAQGNVAPTYTISDAETPRDSPDSVAVGPDGSLFVDDESRVFVFATHSDSAPTLRATFDPGCATFNGACTGGSMAIDHSGHLYVLSGVNSIAVFAVEPNGAAKRMDSLEVPLTDVFPQYVAVDGSSRVLVAGISGEIVSFGRKTFGAVQPTRVGFLATTNETINSMSTDARGTLYFPDEQRNVVYVLRTSTLGRSTLSSITGPDTQLSKPSGVAVDRRGDIFVSEYGNDAVTEFAPGSSGNAVPTGSITGWRTKLDHPTSIAVGEDGRIYVVNGATDVSGFGGSSRTATITAFEGGASGNASPIFDVPFDRTVMYDSL